MIEGVLNWIVQGVAVAVATTVGLRVVGPVRAHARYAVYWAALWVIVCLPVVPLLWSIQPSVTDAHLQGSVGAGLLSVPQAAWNAPMVLGTLAAVWIGSRLVTLIAAVRALGRARRGCRPMPESILASLDSSTKTRLFQARVRLAASTDVRAAAVLGLGSPIIAVHPALLEKLSTTQLDQVVVHEWAHVVRKDARAILVQQLLRTLVGWHPAVWWANRQIHLEREMACDEMVVAVTGAPRAYAACLTYLAALTRAPRHQQLAVGAVGASSLRRRVLQVLAWDGRPLGAARLATAALMSLLVGLSLWVGNVRVFDSAIASAALLEAESLMALAGAAQAPALITPDRPKDAVTPVSQTRTPLARPTRGGNVGALPDTAAFDQQAAGSTGLTSPSTTAVADDAVPIALPAEPLAGFSMPVVPGLLQAPAATDTPAPSGSLAAEAVDLWNAAADAGGRIGRTSQKGAVTTAGFFTRVAKNMARSF